MLSELMRLVNKKWPNCYLTLHYKNAWSIRALNGEIIEYDNGFDKLFELVQEDSETFERFDSSPTREESPSFIPYEEKQNLFDWLELAQDPYSGAEVRI